MKIYTKEELISSLKAIRNQGWIPDARPGNIGGVGNTIEYLLEKEAGKKYPRTEMSFRQTINGLTRSERGFKVVVDREK